MLRLSVLAFALLATGVAAAQNTPGTPNTQPPLPGNPNTQQPADPNSTSAAAPPAFYPGPDLPPHHVVHAIRVSGGVMAGQILTRVDPVYPASARSEHLKGAVVLAVRIGKDGTVQDLQPMSGPPALAEAAIDAVKQWTYKPYLLNGEPVEVHTTVTVNFQLDAPPRSE